MLRKLSVRGKILATLAIPVLVMVVAAAIFSFQAIRDTQVASQAKALVELLDPSEDVMAALRLERQLSVDKVNGVADAQTQLEAARAATDASFVKLRSAYTDLETDLIGATVSRALAEVSVGLAKNTNEIRSAVDRGSVHPEVVADDYSRSIASILNVSQGLADVHSDRRLAPYLGTYVQINRLLDSVSAEEPMVRKVFADQYATQGASVSQRLLQDLTVRIGQTNQLREDARQSINRLTRDDLSLQAMSADYISIRDSVAAGNISAVSPQTAANWSTLTQSEIEKLEPLVIKTKDLTQEAADAALTSAKQRSILTLGVVFGTVLASVLIAMWISRRITVPLKNLTLAATSVRDELPRIVEQVIEPGKTPDIQLEKIDIDSTDEIGRLAAAFNDVNDTTLQVAQDQAALRGSISDMFVNIARRDHVLLNRQLAFLDDLERSEEDANVLADLFKLDHLATRMRRNAESLLVLAGVDSGRRVRQPMPISDVVRTASSEIEQYERVKLNLEADPIMLGHNSLTASHLLAELLENATGFSEPHTPVEVTTTRSNNHVIIEIRDFGLGMRPEEIDIANNKVAEVTASDIIGIQRLGLFVVGRLASKLGADVFFSIAQDDQPGTVVTVSLPTNLFLDDGKLEVGNDAVYSGQFQSLAQVEDLRPATEETAPEVQEVNLEALTDGQTQTGMPRRKVSEAAYPEALADSAELDSGFIPQPAFEVDAPSILPTRTAALRVNQESTETDANPVTGGIFEVAEINDPPVVDQEKRSAVFSKFRAFGSRSKNEKQDSLQDVSVVTEVAESAATTEQAEDVADAGVTSKQTPGTGSESTPLWAPIFEDDATPYEPKFDFEPIESNRTRVPGAQEGQFDPAVDIESLKPVITPDFAPGIEPEAEVQVDTPLEPKAEPEASVVAESDDRDIQTPPNGISGLRRRVAQNEPAGKGKDEVRQPGDLDTGAIILPEIPQLAPDMPDFLLDEVAGLPYEPVFDPTGAAELPFTPIVPEGEPYFIDEAVIETSIIDREEFDRIAADIDLEALNAAQAGEEQYSPTLSDTTDVADAGATPEKPKRKSLFKRLRGGNQNLGAHSAAIPVIDPKKVKDPQAHGLEEPAKHKGKGKRSAEAPVLTGSLAIYVPQTAEEIEGLPEDLQPRDENNNLVSDYPISGGYFGDQEDSFRTAAETHAPEIEADDGEVTIGQVVEQSRQNRQKAQKAIELELEPFADGATENVYGAESAQAELRKPEPQVASTLSQMLAQQSNIQEQALSELSQLSSYRPSSVDTNAAPRLVHRQRSEVAAPIEDPASQKISRDAAVLRSRLSAFQSATRRGREEVEGHEGVQGAQETKNMENRDSSDRVEGREEIKSTDETRASQNSVAEEEEK